MSADQAALARPAGRDEPLEAMRGVAALCVVCWHMLLAFDPARPGVLPGFPPALSWIGRPWYGLVNGGAAVGFFFVLSGFVLTRRSLRTRDAAALARGAAKRWPRLGGTVGLACLVCWALFPLGLYRFREAGALSGSPWLSGFAYSPAGAGIVPDPAAAAFQGFAGTFFTGAASYNSSLWTMQIEFQGSLVAFGLALMLLQIPGPVGRWWLLAIAWATCFCVSPWLANFPLGVALASLSASGRMPRLSPALATMLLAAGYAAATYSDNSALGRAIYNTCGVALPGPTAYGIGGALVLLSMEGTPLLRAALSGPLPRWLGRMSFPIYLLHLPVLLSAGCFAYLHVGGGRLGMAEGVLATLAGTAIAAWPLARFDVWWTARVNAVTARALRPASAASPQQPAAEPRRLA